MKEAELKGARALLNRSEFIELVSVLEGIKPGMRLCRAGKRAGDLSELVSQLGLFEGESAYAVEEAITSGKFVHTPRRLTRRPEKEDRRFVYVGADPLTIRLLKAFDLMDSRRFGLTMGYPDCCVEFFIRNFSRHRHFDLVPEIGLGNGRGYFPLLNYACRHFDYRLLSHFPCRWDCESSLKLARQTLQALQRHDPKLAQETLYWLESDVIYSPQFVIAVKDTTREENVLSLRKGFYRITGNLEADTVRFEQESATLIKDRITIREVRPYQWLPFQTKQTLLV